VEAEGNSSDDSVCDNYLTQAAELFTSECIIGILASTGVFNHSQMLLGFFLWLL